MSRWPVDRYWTIERGDGSRTRIRTAQLVDHRACCLLGSAALGKTTELLLLSDLERAVSIEVHSRRLALLATSAENLERQLKHLSALITANTALYLDALDEAMIPVRTSGIILASWIRDSLAETKPRLRLVCRTAVWPPELWRALGEVYGEDLVKALLQPLSHEDIETVAAWNKLDAAQFISNLRHAGSHNLAKQPLCLKMLIGLSKSQLPLPSHQCDLFRDSVARLTAEPFERRQIGTASDYQPHELVEVAERLSCYTLLSGKESIEMGDDPAPDALGWIELGSLPTGSVSKLTEPLLRAVGLTGLCEGDGTSRYWFAHRQLAEYLAGHRLAQLKPHQSKALLASVLGWQHGVASPLRETAAFAAMENPELATWLSQSDPEVIGLSDVADDALRRRGLLQLFEKFRAHELTDVQASGEIEFRGFKYPGISADLKVIIREGIKGGEDLLACAIELVEGCELTDLSDDLVAVFLDKALPTRLRRAAGYALVQMGTVSARRRLKLHIDDLLIQDRDLVGLAMRCNWPEALSTHELFAAIVPKQEHGHFGPMDGFLLELDDSGFDGADALPAGLMWARAFLRRGEDYDPSVRIAKRIAHRAAGELHRPDVLVHLVDLVLQAAKQHADSPLGVITQGTTRRTDKDVAPPMLNMGSAVRHALIEGIATRDVDSTTVWWAVHETPGLLRDDDGLWLLHCATNSLYSNETRRNYVELLRLVAWYDDPAAVDAWLDCFNIEPVASVLPLPLSVELDSKVAKQARKELHRRKRSSKGPRRRRVIPPPAERVNLALRRAETEDVRFFIDLCQELTLEEFSTHYGFERFLTRTPGWNSAGVRVKTRIVEAAKRLLTTETNEPEKSREAPFSSILIGYIHAVWLLLELEPAWLEARSADWWERWAWYLLRELHPNMSGEDDVPKRALLELVHRRARIEVEGAILRLAASREPGSRDLLESLLRLLDPIRDGIIDEAVGDAIRDNRCNPDRIGVLAEFVLLRDSGIASVCFDKLDVMPGEGQEAIAVQAALALLFERTAESWDRLHGFLRKHPHLAKQILSEFAYNRRLRHKHGYGDTDESHLSSLGIPRVAQLVALLIEQFPPEHDPKRSSGFVGPEEAARDLRGRLISWLSEQASGEAVASLRKLERDFGSKYPWLRRPRARAERAFRKAHWRPIPAQSVAEVLASASRALIRSECDALDGVEEALRAYQERLFSDGISDLEDFWNLPTKGPPSPKVEERASDKICGAIREYFKTNALTADREVQVFRRKVRQSLGGEPGSEVDVLVRVPAVGAVETEAISLPVEVKLSHNPEAKTGLGDQLADRYMRQLGTQIGAFIVVWLDAPGLPSSVKPVWQSADAAREDLNQQARQVEAEGGSARRILVVVIDASLRQDRPKNDA